MMLDIAEAAVRQRCSMQPRVGIILGSGLGGLADSIQDPTSIPYQAIAGFPSTTAQGHRGSLILGTISGVPVVVMQGRSHLYEGNSIEQVAFPVQLMERLGAKSLIVSNASGGINPRFSSGEVVLIDSHINMMSRPWKRTGNGESIDLPLRHASVYDEIFQRKAIEIAAKSGFALARGTYLATLGPTYETRAEYRFFRWIGADMVGMSTVPEVLAAIDLGMQVIGFSIVTNVANPDVITKTDHAEVLDWAKVAQQRLLPLVQALLPQMA